MCHKRQGVDLWKARSYMCPASSVAEAAFEAQRQVPRQRLPPGQESKCVAVNVAAIREDSRAAAGNEAGNVRAGVTQGEKRHRRSPSASHRQRFFWLDPGGGTASVSLSRVNREALHAQHTEQAVKEVEGVGGFLLPREVHGQGTDDPHSTQKRG
ncbi:hypothetical protein MY11210_009351 [Beauveria gryllotalpidicola]